MGNIRKTYTFDEKLQAITLYYQNELSCQEIADKLNIPSSTTVKRWVKHFEAEGEAGLEEKRGKALGIVTGKGRPRTRPETPEQEMKRLRAENEFLKKWLGLDK
ncbi:helix-turn-helix domain-containing protein [Tumebacillus permanentifrigoris]|uniref:Transposase n=1 Tax=Tumebacillus permanentifrigoris TaxID=378543 RepID=A0A316D3Y3_9BACL|nr:helix-turn-helix domain-containing protein [Tumebacillus permanentifrigoris]PWJ98174.1 transposase [Tumebacillus permanentifrigoris]